MGALEVAEAAAATIAKQRELHAYGKKVAPYDTGAIERATYPDRRGYRDTEKTTGVQKTLNGLLNQGTDIVRFVKGKVDAAGATYNDGLTIAGEGIKAVPGKIVEATKALPQLPSRIYDKRTLTRAARTLERLDDLDFHKEVAEGKRMFYAMIGEGLQAEDFELDGDTGEVHVAIGDREVTPDLRKLITNYTNASDVARRNAATLLDERFGHTIPVKEVQEEPSALTAADHLALPAGEEGSLEGERREEPLAIEGPQTTIEVTKAQPHREELPRTRRRGAMTAENITLTPKGVVYGELPAEAPAKGITGPKKPEDRTR